MYYIY